MHSKVQPDANCPLLLLLQQRRQRHLDTYPRHARPPESGAGQTRPARWSRSESDRRQAMGHRASLAAGPFPWLAGVRQVEVYCRAGSGVVEGDRDRLFEQRRLVFPLIWVSITGVRFRVK